MQPPVKNIPPPTLEYNNHIATGFPSPAMDYLQPRIDFNKEFIKHPLSTFIIECEGTSMINAFIAPKSKLIIDRSITPRNGHIVLAVLNGEFLVRRLVKNAHKCFLRAENSKFQEIEISTDSSMNIWGVVILIINDPYKF